MYWKAAIVKYKGENHVRVGVGIFIFQTKADEEPVLHILGTLKCSGVKKKWRVPMKIKRWLLYDPHSYSYASRYLFNNNFKITEIGEKTELGLFDKDIIFKKFPTMYKGVNLKGVSGKKKRK